jgi:hypothetical protein
MFPVLERDSLLDLLCKVDGGHFVLVEVQLQNQDHWDSRALADAAGFFGNQSKLGGKWQDLKQVIAVNILGKGNRESDLWSNCPEEIFRHYVFTNIVNACEPKHTIQDLRLSNIVHTWSLGLGSVEG